jgi:putative copper resistance protein D
MKTKNLNLIILPVVGLLITFFIQTINWQSPAPLIPDSGPLVFWLKPVLVSLSYALAIAVISLLISDGIFIKFRGKNSFLAGKFALALSGVSFSAAVFTLAQSLSQPISITASLNVIVTYGFDVSSVRSLLLISLVAFITFIILLKPSLEKVGLLTVLNVLALSLPALFSHGGGVGNHQWATAAGLFHGLSTTLWISGLAGVFLVISNKDNTKNNKISALNKFSQLATVSVVTLVISGSVNAWTRLNSLTDFMTTNYGQILLLKFVLLSSSILIALTIRSRVEQNITKLVLIELCLLLFTLGVSVALASTSYPKTGDTSFTLIESVSGFPEPIKFSWAYALTTFAFEPLTLVVGLIAISLYVAGYWKLTKRGDKWPLNRLIFWTSGVLIGIYITNSMLARYAILMFSAHMSVHMVLAMIVPILLPLGAPVTLALRALSPSQEKDEGLRNIRDWIVALMNSNYLKTLSHPLIAFFLFATGTWILYFTPLLTVLMGSHLGHIFMDVHFVLAGYLFFWLIIGIDPAPRKIPDVLRLVMVFAAAVFHGLFGFISFSANTPLGGGWFSQIVPSWLTDQIQDQQLGGGIAWGFGEIPIILVLAILVYQWAARDEKIAKRVSDQEIDDYNNYLKSLNK